MPAAPPPLRVRLSAKTYGTIEFGMSDARREALVAAPAAATRDYFARHTGGLEALDDGLIGPTDESDRIALSLLSYE